MKVVPEFKTFLVMLCIDFAIAKNPKDYDSMISMLVQFCAAVSNTFCAVICSSHLSRCHITQ